MKPAALGFRVHSGWTSLVAVSLEKGEPRVLVRQRPRLVAAFTYEYRQPYHIAEKMSIDKANVFIARVESEAQHLAEAAIRSVQTELREQGYKLTSFGLLLASGKPLPSLDKILSSHALIHTADGELFRRALTQAGERCGMAAHTIKESELFSVASKSLGIEHDDLMSRLKTLGKPFGSPWSQDEKFATLAAWVTLAGPHPHSYLGERTWSRKG
jgi:hypothetical protein